MVTIQMENGKEIKIELYPQIAPITVENFISLVKDGFYDGLTFLWQQRRNCFPQCPAMFKQSLSGRRTL